MCAVVVDVPRHIAGVRSVDRDAPVEIEDVRARLVRRNTTNKFQNRGQRGQCEY